jgi:hypothetical protein
MKLRSFLHPKRYSPFLVTTQPGSEAHPSTMGRQGPCALSKAASRQGPRGAENDDLYRRESWP